MLTRLKFKLTRLNFLASITCLRKLNLLKIDAYFASMLKKNPTILFSCLLEVVGLVRKIAFLEISTKKYFLFCEEAKIKLSSPDIVFFVIF